MEANYLSDRLVENLFFERQNIFESGYAARRVAPADAHYDLTAHEFLLPYESVRTAEFPEEALLSFWRSTYEAAADLGRWDRAVLDRR